MIRCAQCGIRLRDVAPQCARHGLARTEAEAAAHSAAPGQEHERLRLELARRGLHISGVLGEGGFATVYKVTCEDGSERALKIAAPTPQASESLARELAVLARVGPPHVPKLYTSGSAAGRAYVLLEIVSGTTLAELLVAQAGPLPVTQFGTRARAVLRAVAAIHARGFAHRDLKPENIFLRTEDQATIIDFGLAQGGPLPVIAVDPTSEGAGTAEYMAPEQCDGLADADPRSDVYSVGVLLYEMLSGAPPFWGKPADVREAQRSARPSALFPRVRCSRELEQLLRRCLAKDRAQRFARIEEVDEALESALFARLRSMPPAAATTGEPQPAVAAQPARERRSVGLVFFESKRGVGAVQTLLVSCGGQIVQTNGTQYIAAFGHEMGDNPVQLALSAAQRLWRVQHSERLLVDVASVSVQSRPDGSRRFFSPLFAKKERFPSASDPSGVLLTRAACDVLDEVRIVDLERTDLWLVDQSEGPADATTQGMRGVPMVGRDAFLSDLVSSARRAHDQNLPTLITVSAHSGHGKTHLASVLAGQLAQPGSGARLIRLSSSEGGAGSIAHTLPQLLARALDLPRDAPADGGQLLLVERLGATLGEQVWAAAALTLGWIDLAHPDVRRLAAAPGALRSAAARAAGEALRRSASQQPLSLLVDDADRVDELTLDALEYATLQEAGARLWVVVFVRPSFERTRPAWGTRAGHSKRLTLEPLDERDAADLARDLLSPVEYVPPAVLAKLIQRTHGVPLLMVELIRGLKREGFVRASQRGTGHYLATDALDNLPDLPIVQWSASREIEALPPQLAAHARLASVLGDNFSVAEMEALFAHLERSDGTHEAQLDAGVGAERLVEASVLRRHRSGSFDFRHALLRDTIYQMLPEAQRKRLHAAAFEMYRRLPAPTAEQQARLARHAARAGEKDVAGVVYLELARGAAEIHAYLEAEAGFSRALDNLAPSEQTRVVEARRGRGLMRFRLGRHEDALQDLRRARELAEGQPAAVLELMADEATVLDWTREYVESAALVRMIEASGVPDGTLLAAQLSMGLARIYHRAGNAEASTRLGMRAAEQARALGDAGYETRVIALNMSASDLANLGRLEEAEACFESVIAEASARGDMLHLGGAYGNRALLWFARKDCERLFQDLSSSIRIARELGYPLLEYLNTCNLAEVRYAMADLDAATEHSHRALELAKQLWGEASLELGTRELLLARVALYREDLAETRALSGSIRRRMAAERSSGAAHIDLLPSEQVLLEMVELAAAAFAPGAWDAFLTRTRGIDLQPMEEVEILECRALCALRAGRAELTRTYFQAAIELSAAKPNLLSERVTRKFVQVSNRC